MFSHVIDMSNLWVFGLNVGFFLGCWGCAKKLFSLHFSVFWAAFRAKLCNSLCDGKRQPLAASLAFWLLTGGQTHAFHDFLSTSWLPHPRHAYNLVLTQITSPSPALRPFQTKCLIAPYCLTLGDALFSWLGLRLHLAFAAQLSSTRSSDCKGSEKFL